MKKTGIYLLSSIAAISASAAPLVSIGDKVDVFFNASLSESWTSNLYSDHDNEVDDFVTTLKLGLSAEYARDTTFTLKAGFTESFLWYASESHLNNDLFSCYITGNYNGDRYKSGLTFTYAQLQDNNNDIGGSYLLDGYVEGLVRYDTYNTSWTNYYDLTPKINLDLNFYWTGKYFQTYTNLYSDSDIYTLPFDIMYAVTEKIRLGVATQYRKTLFTGGTGNSYWGDDRDDFFLGITLNGELTPKLSAKIYWGGSYRIYNEANDAVDNELTMAMSAALNYKVSEKVNSYLNFSRDFGSGASRQSIIDTSLSIGANYAFSERIRMTASFAYTNSDYQYDSGRMDDRFMPKFAVSYSPITNLSFSFSYNYIYNMSNIETSEYDRHYLSLSASFKY